MWQDLWQDDPSPGITKARLSSKKKFLQRLQPHDMEVTADDTRLYGDYTDATRVVCRVTDRVSTTLVYFPGIIQVENNGPIQVIGPSAIPVRAAALLSGLRQNLQSFSKC